MSEPPQEPEWNRLPRDPAGFFGLSGEFDRKDLKRAYNSLLRIYKPEKYPEEFQRIRAAFEQLDEQLRYGSSGAMPDVGAGGGWAIDEMPQGMVREVVRSSAAERGAREQVGAATPASSPLVDRLATEDPQALYQELKQKTDKAPFDYYALAVISDVVEKQPMAFVEWLLRGIAAHPRSGPLLNLLHAYLRTPQPAAALVKLLPAIAKVLKDDRFFGITEPAWNTLLKEGEFKVFAELFERCRSEVRDAEIVCQMVFLINILRIAMWRADPAWTRAQLDYINANFEQIPPWLEGDVDLLSEIAGYLTVRDKFLAGPPPRAAIDKAMRDYFCEDQPTGDASVINCHLQILADTDGLLAALELEENETYSKVFTMWTWMSHDVAERHGQPLVEEVDQQVWVNRTQAMLERCVTAGQRSTTYQLWNLTEWGQVVAVAFAALVALAALSVAAGFMVDAVASALSLGSSEADSVTGVVVLVLAGVVAAGVPYWLWPRVKQKLWMPVRQQFAKKCYDRIWRREVVAFQRRSHLPDSFFRALFEHFAPMHQHTQWINFFVQQDYAPAMVAMAQRFEL
jgi:hypothetical protein